MSRTKWRIALAVALLAMVAVGAIFVVPAVNDTGRMHVVAYFDNSNGLYRKDEVRILGVRVGAIDSIEPQTQRVKITFWVDRKYKVPADAKAVIISPQLVTSRAIQLTPAYRSGPTMSNGATIPQNRTAVPLEWDDLRAQLKKLASALQPTEPGGVSTLGAFINTAAENLRGQGPDIRKTLINLSQALSILGDHSDDIFSTVKNLSVVVSALNDSAALMKQLNQNLASVTGLLDGTPDAVGNAVKDLDAVADKATRFLKENRDAVGTTNDKLASITSAVHDSLDDVEQALHLFPNTLQNFLNIYQPSQLGITGALNLTNFNNPLGFICGAIQAASKLNAEQSSKLCVQYMAPIVKNRQINWLPLGENYIVGEAARPNELTYSEDWLRPDYVPKNVTAPAQSQPLPPGQGPLPAEAAPPPGAPAGPPAPGAERSVDPSTGLAGMMVPAAAAPGGGS
ncbi:virulence factor Mce family protein [Mycobacterium intracellulare]|uniref:virulence factor Mce family protein n=1 Tax=Mycobacterium intracellulare TaxID=1767 RepID=UPI00080BA4F3|nr:virulence factor Mce family protein [Mycobacterium intracellulare]OCB22483.1 mammalian cell entry protein [Mycobacterium intracellulare subsp. yongonense]